MSDTNLSGGSHFGTRLESFEEIREATGYAPLPPSVTPAPAAPPGSLGDLAQQSAPGRELRHTRPEGTGGADAVVAYRPVRRPPLALLCILDDGREDGEWVRLRGDRVVIGRTDGDLRIPHDSMMSSRHAEISRTLDRDRYRWYVTDLDSTNGTYLRIANSVLRSGQEFLIGTHRFRFTAGGPAAPPAAAPATPPPPEEEGTRGWQVVSAAELRPSLVELGPRGEERRFYLERAECWLGRDPGCDVALADDLLLNPRHARLYRDEKKRWHLENARTRNGVWLRIDRMPVESGTAQFQLGEQRFLLRIL